MITGGIGIFSAFLDSTEILDIAEENVTMASPLNPKFKFTTSKPKNGKPQTSS